VPGDTGWVGKGAPESGATPGDVVVPAAAARASADMPAEGPAPGNVFVAVPAPGVCIVGEFTDVAPVGTGVVVEVAPVGTGVVVVVAAAAAAGGVDAGLALLLTEVAAPGAPAGAALVP
jgi:hypothetical protein